MKTAMLRGKQGFTLIEIIIVVVILGILAAVALPKITQNIGKAVAAEAFNIGGETAKAYDRCLAEQSGGVAVTGAMAALCDTWAELNMTAPPATNFTYTLSLAGTTLTLTAAAVTKNGLVAGTDSVTFTMAGATGVVTKACSAGTLLTMCK